MSVKTKKSPLNLGERTIIQERYRYGYSMRDIAKELDRNVSTIIREINGKPRKGIGKYIAYLAHRQALERIKKRGNISKIDKYLELKEYIIKKLKLGWSPEQISGRLRKEYPSNQIMCISHEAIYQYYKKNNMPIPEELEKTHKRIERESEIAEDIHK